MLKEFREFALKGNMVDLAIGVVIGAAFGKIVDSLVNDLLMPVLGLLTGGVDFANKYAVLKAGKSGASDYASLDAALKDGAVTLSYGLFINAIVSFLIVAFALFFVVKALNRLKRAEADAPAEPAAPPQSEVLLAEIRDLLKK